MIFVELSKYRFDRIEFINNDEILTLNYFDLIPRIVFSKVDYSLIKETCNNDASDLLREYIENYESVNDIDFIRAEVVSACQNEMSDNEWAFLLSCLYHKKRIDSATISKLKMIRKIILNKYAFTINYAGLINTWKYHRVESSDEHLHIDAEAIIQEEL